MRPAELMMSALPSTDLLSSSSSIDDDLLCCEDSSEVFSGDSPGGGCSTASSTTETEDSIEEESIVVFIEGEREFVPGGDYLSRFHSRSLDESARADAVAWILKVQSYYGFQPLTAYLSVNYMDRFLCSSRLPQQSSGWPMQLLSVACLSLAAKMEEPLVPPLLDFQVEGSKYVFEPRTIGRMELLVLTVLDWRLRSVTPFSYIGFFACKIDPSGTYIGYLISRATEIILCSIKEASFLEYRQSSTAAAAILCAASEIPNLPLVSPEHAESWCEGLSKETIVGCYRLMRGHHGLDDANRRNQPKVYPPMRVTIRARLSSIDSSSSSSFSSTHKRRKLSDCFWVADDDGKGCSE